MSKNVSLSARTLEDPIVLIGIEAVNHARISSQVEGFISGGMAVQSYLPKESARPTVDLDFNLFWGGNTAEFRMITLPMVNYLTGINYSVEFQRADSAFEYYVSAPEDRSSLLIQHQRRSIGNFQAHKKSLEREMANKRSVSKFNITYPVASPEDLVLRKLNRCLVHSQEYDVEVPRVASLEEMKNINDLTRENILSRLANVKPEEVARLRLYSDCLDVMSLAAYAGLNRNYFDEGLRDWTNKYTARDFIRALDRLGVTIE